MEINIIHGRPANISQLYWRYTIGSLLFLGLVACSVTLDVFSFLLDTGYAEIFENTAFVLFVSFGFTFEYLTEKRLGYRRLEPKQ